MLEARHGHCAQSAAAPAATGRARAPLHVPLRGAGPGGELKARLLQWRWLRAPRYCAVGVLVCMRCREHTVPPGAEKTARDGTKEEALIRLLRRPAFTVGLPPLRRAQTQAVC